MGHIGDVVLVTPAIELLHTMFPSATVSMLVRKGTEPVLSHHPGVQRVFSSGEIVSQQKMHVQTRSTLRQRLAKIPRGFDVVGMLRREKFDLAVDFTSGDRSAIMAFMSGAPIRVGHAARGTGFAGRDGLYTHLSRVSEIGLHKVVKDAELLRDAAIATGRPHLAERGVLVPGPLSMNVTAMDETWARTRWGMLSMSGQKRVVVHPTSRVRYKCWPAERWHDVIDRLVGEHNVSVVVTSGPDVDEIAFAQRVAGGIKGVHVHGGDLTLGTLSALIKDADLFMGVDTAPMHVAAAVGTRVVAVFGPSDDRVWGPWGKGHVVVRAQCSCLASGKRGCDENEGMQCLRAVSADAVYAAATGVLAL